MDRLTLQSQMNAPISRIGKICVWLLYGSGAFLAFVTAFEGKHYYSAWGFEHAPFTYGTAIQLFIASEMALLCYYVTKHLHRANLCSYSPTIWILVIMTFLYASMDESLAIHERLFLMYSEHHHEIYAFVFGSPDDLFVISCGIGALIFTAFFLRELKPVPQARRLYLVGLFLLILAGSIDYLPSDLVEGLVPFGTEELSEYFAGTSFAVAFLLFALDRFKIMAIDWIYHVETAMIQDKPYDKNQVASPESLITHK